MACDPGADANDDDGPVRGREHNKNKHSYEQWTHHESKELLRLLAEEVNNDVCFKKELITSIVLPKLNAKFGGNKEYSHVKNKFKCWRRRLETTKELDAYGIGWDPKREVFMATDETWEKLKKDHPKAALLRNKIFEDYDELKLVVSHYHPRKDATVLTPTVDILMPVTPTVDILMPVTERKKENAVEIEGATPIMTALTPLSISQGLNAGSPSSSSTSIQRKRNAALMVESPKEPFNANSLKFAKNFDDSGGKLLSAVDRVMEEMKWRAYEVFTTPTIREAFLRMPHDERLRWLLFKLKRTISDQP